tara:strand:+ start:875 stop:2344 length:1470 start_codon:yes stop_codon:yes gene_type:complete
MSGLSAAVVQWAAKRGVSVKTLREAGCGTAWEIAGKKSPCIVFPYFRDGKQANAKTRSLAGKDFRTEPGSDLIWYNLDRVLTGKFDTVYVVEGEMDALSLMEADIPNVLSVPSGGPATASNGSDPASARRYEFVRRGMEDGLDQVKKWVLCTDSDGPGRHLRSDLATLLGAGKCHWVEWPEGIKDANDALAAWGGRDLHIFVNEGQQEYPVEGLYRLSQIPEPAPLVLWNPGFAEWENRFRIAPTCVSVVSGYPGHGKSHFTQQVWAQIARDYNVRVAIMSMETREKPFVRRTLRSAYWRKLEMDMSEREKTEADDWIEEHFVFLHHPRRTPEFGWVSDMIETAHARMGISAVSIDPWNMVVPGYDSRTSTETRWIGECLDDCAALAKGITIHVQIVAHPSKPGTGDASTRPITYDRISGSQHWANKPDQVLSIHRDAFADKQTGARLTEAAVRIHKSRYDELGFPTKFNVRLDLQTGCFHSVDYSSIG